jgi:hypothetical protein
MRVSPSLPQRGRQSKGSIPLTPSFLKSIIFNLIKDYRTMGDARAAGAEARCKKEPKRVIDCFYEGFSKAKKRRTTPTRFTWSGWVGFDHRSFSYS